MSDNSVVSHMIAFVEEKEKQLQSEKMLGENAARNDVVRAILDELEKEVSNEDK